MVIFRCRAVIFKKIKFSISTRNLRIRRELEEKKYDIFFPVQGGYIPVQGGYIPEQGGYVPVHGGYILVQGGYIPV